MKRRLKHRTSSIFLSLALLALTFVFMMPVIEELQNTFQLSQSLKEVQAELLILEQENTLLEEQKTKLLDPEYVKSYARANYMLTKDGEQIYYLPQDDKADE
jgi:cell division protein DivIC